MRILLVLLLGAATVAEAQNALPEKEVRTGSRIPTDVEKRDYEYAQVRKVQHAFAECVVAEQRDNAIRYLTYLSIKDDDADARKLIRKIADGQCLIRSTEGYSTVQMNLPGDTMRYILSDALLRTQLGTTLTDLDRVAPLEHPKLDEADYQPEPGKKANAKKLQELAEDRQRELARIYLSQFGECVVRADPGVARELLLTVPDSEQENVAFGRVRPLLAQCLEAGRTLELNKIIVRGTVAYNYYRLAHAPRMAVPERG